MLCNHFNHISTPLPNSTPSKSEKINVNLQFQCTWGRAFLADSSVRACTDTPTTYRPAHLIIVEAMAPWNRGHHHKSEVTRNTIENWISLQMRIDEDKDNKFQIAFSPSCSHSFDNLIIEPFSSAVILHFCLDLHFHCILKSNFRHPEGQAKRKLFDLMDLMWDLCRS